MTGPFEMPAPQVPDHVLLRCIGTGSYGEVWLAQNVMRTYRAVKVVYRQNFEDRRPYEREYEGIQKFEPVSRTHEGLVDILQVGRNDPAGYFYYVMELADDLIAEQLIDPTTYEAKNLGREAAARGRIPSMECLQIGLSLTAALSQLHKNGLIHRDLKPSNIIFVHGLPKVADIGLVAQVGSTASYVGTEGFIPPEGPGSIQADIYSLGKVLYEISTGQDRKIFPALPTKIDEISEHEDFIELNEIILRACESDPKKRYRTADEMHDDLVLLRAGKSVRRIRSLEKRLALLTRVALIVTMVLIIGAVAYYQVHRARQLATRRLAESFIEYGARFQESGDLIGALPSYAAALKLEQNDPDRVANHRVRIGVTVQQSPSLANIWFLPAVLNNGGFTADGRGILTAGGDGKVYFLDLKNEQRILTLAGSSKELESAVVSDDGTRLLTGGTDGEADLWDHSTQKHLQSFQHPATVYSAKFSPNREFVLTACEDGLARLWRSTGDLVRTFAKHHDTVRNASFSHDGNWVLTASHDGTAQQWETSTGRPRGHPLKHSNWIYDASYSRDSRKIITASYDNSARIWDAETGELRRVLYHDGAVRSARFSPDGRHLVTACWDVNFTVRFWDAETGLETLPPLHHNDYVTKVAYDLDGKYLLTIGYRGVVSLWDLYPQSREGVSQTAFFSGDGERSATIAPTGIEFSATSGNRTGDIHINGRKTNLTEILLSENGRMALTIETNAVSPTEFTAQVILWADRKENYPSFRLEKGITRWKLSMNGEKLVGWGNKNLIVWETQSGQVHRRITLKEDLKSCLFDPGADFVLGVAGESIFVWNIASGNSEHVFQQGAPVESAEFEPSGKFLAVACAELGLGEGYAVVWDFENRKRLGTVLKHRIDGVAYAAISPDRRKVVTAGEDKICWIWDLRSGKQLSQPLLHKGQVVSAAFSPDGRWVATSCMDGSIRTWDAETGQAITPRLITPWGPDILVYVQFLDSGRKVVAKRKSGASVVWNLLPDPRPIEDVETEAHLLSGHYSDPGQTRAIWPLSKDELFKKWDAMRSKYPKTIIPSPVELVGWHLLEAQRCEMAGQTSGALFHLERVAQLRVDERNSTAPAGVESPE